MRPNVGLVLAQRLRCWPNIKAALGQRLVFAGECPLCHAWWPRSLPRAIHQWRMAPEGHQQSHGGSPNKVFTWNYYGSISCLE